MVPLGRRYMNIDTELARRSFVVEKDDTVHKVYLEGVLLAEVTEDGGSTSATATIKMMSGFPASTSWLSTRRQRSTGKR